MREALVLTDEGFLIIKQFVSICLSALHFVEKPAYYLVKTVHLVMFVRFSP